MFADPANSSPLGPALLSSIGAVIVAVIAGIFAWLSNSKSNRNAADIQEYKSATDRDLEHLKAKLAHGQLISSTQWNVEFNAYQSIWKAVVSVRNDTADIATFEQQMQRLDLLTLMSDAQRLASGKDKAKALSESLNQLSDAVQHNAPFYPPDIRKIAVSIINPLRDLVSELLVFTVAHTKGANWDAEKLTGWRTHCNQQMEAAFISIESLDGAIRERLNTVRVIAN